MESDREFWQIARCFLIRYHEYNREKGVAPIQLEEFQHQQARLMAQQELKEAVITKLVGLELKSDYHNLVALAFLQDLAKWSSEYESELKLHPGPQQCLVTQSIQLLAAQQQFHTIVAKQNELVAALLPLPATLANHEHFRSLYRRLKDVKEYFPAAVREHQKKCFQGAMEEVIATAGRMRNLKVLQFIFGNIFNELEVLQQTHECVTARLRVLRRLVKSLWVFHEDMLFKLSYLLMKYSYHIPTNPHLTAHLLPIHAQLLDRLLERPNIAALLLVQHVLLNNIKTALKEHSSCIILEGLLGELTQIFTHGKLEYFLRQYDWNFLEVGVCQESLALLYDYVENRGNEKRPQYELVKVYLTRIHALIKSYLQGLKGVAAEEKQEKFYNLKKREYTELLEELNTKPKKVFKRVESMSNAQVREAAVQRLARLVKKSSHIENKAMIDIFSTDHPVSAALFSAYAQLLLKQCRQHNLEQFMRLFTSNFFISGESQQIARVVDTMTQLYYSRQETGSQVLKSSDATYTFANAILILNTDLHNPKNEQKISEENFIKMCRKINDGEDINDEIVKKTYANIKRNKINTFRDRKNMLGISVANWMLICTDYDSVPLPYYDHELQALDDHCFRGWAREVLSGIIDEKQTAKLQQLVERFVYSDKVFECEVIEVLRKAVDRKPHLPLHIFQKTLEIANFRNARASDQLLSYYWLAAQLALTFPTLLPTNLLCQFLVLTWGLRADLQDNMHLRQAAEVRRVRECMRVANRRENKRSLMDMFSSFLSFKESDEEVEPLPNQFNKRANFKSISNNVFDVLRFSPQHRRLSVDFLIGYIHREESKLYEEFVSCLFLTFNLLYLEQDSEQLAEDLFYELLGLKESEITRRLGNLGKKDPKLYDVLINYCRFWILKLLFKEYKLEKLETKQNNTYDYLLNQSLGYLEKADKEILQDLIKELLGKNAIQGSLLQILEKALKKVYKEGSTQEMQTLIQKLKNQGAVIKKTEGKQGQIKEKELQNESKNENAPVTQETLNNQKTETKAQQKLQPQLNVDNPPVDNENCKDKKQIQVPTKDEGYEQPSKQKEQQKNLHKRGSVSQLQAYIDPDAIIDQIDQEISEHHAKKADEEKGEKHPVEKSDQRQEVAETEEIAKEQGQAASQSMKKQQKVVSEAKSGEQNAGQAGRESAQQDKSGESGPSLPVIFF